MWGGGHLAGKHQQIMEGARPNPLPFPLSTPLFVDQNSLQSPL